MKEPSDRTDSMWNGLQIGELPREFRYVDDCISGKIEWYKKNKISKQWLSKLLRFSSLSFAIVGALIPIIPDTSYGTPDIRFGYVFFALSAMVYLFDRWFGFSGSWMRYMEALNDLEAQRELLRLKFLTLPPGAASETANGQIAELALEALLRSHQTVKRDTDQWAHEFRTHLDEVRRLAAERQPKST